MKASAGLGMMVVVAALAAAPAFAQAGADQQPQQSETVGPRELRDFSLPGTSRPPATAQPQPQPQPETPSQAAPTAPGSASPAERPAARQSAPRDVPTEPRARQPKADAPPLLQSQPSDATPPVPEGSFLTQPAPGPAEVPPAATTPASQDSSDMLPWLAAAVLAAAAAAFAIHRRRSRAALANVAELESFVPAEPPPPPARRSPAPPAPGTASQGGLVSARLRPALELEFTPLRCIVDDRQATIEFALVAMNNGNAPARDVRVEVAMINAGPAQDQEIGRFFQQPAGIGEPMEAIPPMRSIRLDSRVSLPLDQVRAFEVAGRRLFVPLLAFNALYSWSGGSGQTSLSFLLGRDGKGEKMAPFRLDLGPRIFRNLAARPHHMDVRR